MPSIFAMVARRAQVLFELEERVPLMAFEALVWRISRVIWLRP
jgi:hypothetical protein